MENKKQGVSLGVVILLALVALVMGIVIYMYFKDLSTNKLVKGFDLNLKTIQNNIDESNANNNTKGEIDTFIDKIFLGNGLYQEAIPEFNSIQEANKDWIYAILYYNLSNDSSNKQTFTYDEIESKLESLIGKNTSIEFPKEGTNKIVKADNSENDYQLQNIELDNSSYQGYTISNISVSGENDIVEINEFQYKISEDKESYIFVDKYGKELKTYPTSYDNEEDLNKNLNEMKNYVTQNTDRFLKKEVTLGKDVQTGNLYIISVKVK